MGIGMIDERIEQPCKIVAFPGSLQYRSLQYRLLDPQKSRSRLTSGRSLDGFAASLVVFALVAGLAAASLVAFAASLVAFAGLAGLAAAFARPFGETKPRSLEESALLRRRLGGFASSRGERLGRPAHAKYCSYLLPSH